MEEEDIFTRLMAGFSTGYSIPQLCQDLGIKKPLFLVNKLYKPSQFQFLWTIHAQFCFDKFSEIQPSFSVIQYDSLLKNFEADFCDFSFRCEINGIAFLEFSSLNLENYDKIFILSLQRENIPNAVYLMELMNAFLIRAYGEIPLLHFLQTHPKVKMFIVTHPVLQDNPENTEREKQLLKGEIFGGFKNIHDIRKKIEMNPNEEVVTPYDFLGYDNKTVYKLLEVPGAKTLENGTAVLNDKADGITEIHNGKRVTAYQPAEYKNKIYFLGNCIYYGFGVPFNKTVESCLQKLLVENNFPYRVENESQPFNGRYQDLFYNLNNLPVKDNDIIFANLNNMLPIISIPSIELDNIFFRPHNYGEVFADMFHINELGHAVLAIELFKFLVQNNFFQNFEFNYPAPPPPPHRYGIPKENFFDSSNFADNKDLEIYKQKLRERRLPIGAIVMNCNPFTNGHKFLIECAAARVHKLYIFVVEEDKSEFKFADRLKLVQEGTKEFPNVEVIPSGQFIISQKTFSGYFNKENLQNVQVDSTQDVEIFAREIAPTLGINIRFVGEEPEDTVTRQYNENMKNILPSYGIDFCEIPRKEFNGEVISAKTVRKYLKVGDFEKIAKLVPKNTLEFLIENYSTPPRCRLTKIKIIGGIFIWLILQSVTNAQIAARR